MSCIHALSAIMPKVVALVTLNIPVLSMLKDAMCSMYDTGLYARTYVLLNL